MGITAQFGEIAANLKDVGQLPEQLELIFQINDVQDLPFFVLQQAAHLLGQPGLIVDHPDLRENAFLCDQIGSGRFFAHIDA